MKFIYATPAWRCLFRSKKLWPSLKDQTPNDPSNEKICEALLRQPCQQLLECSRLLDVNRRHWLNLRMLRIAAFPPFFPMPTNGEETAEKSAISESLLSGKHVLVVVAFPLRLPFE